VLILAAVLGVLLLPLVGEAQQAEKAPRIGVTLVGSPPSPYAEALRRGLAELGWFDGRNIVIEYRYAEGRRDRYAAFMADLIDLKVHVIVAGGGKVGYYLARSLLEEGHEVLLIERDRRRADSIAEDLGSIVLRGDACEASTLADAGASRADVVVAVTGDDGSFSLKGLPPGEYTIETWHEKLGVKTATVKVGDKESKDAEFTYEGK